MPEYLTPGVYLEETSFRSRSIEGVATSTFGMAGMTEYGPVPYVVTPPGSKRVAMVPSPTLVTSFTEFERAFGGLGDVGTLDDKTNYLAYAARAFFGNGGRRLYVSRVFPFTLDAQGEKDLTKNFAALLIGGTPPVATWRARWPGSVGNEISVQVSCQRSKNILHDGLKGVSAGAAVELFPNRDSLPKDRVIDPVTKKAVAVAPKDVRMVAVDPATKRVGLLNPDGSVAPVVDDGKVGVCHLTLTVTIRWGGRRTDVYPGLELGDVHSRSVSKVLQAEDPTDEFSLAWLDIGASTDAKKLLDALLGLADETHLSGASDGEPLGPEAIKGEPADSDDASVAATGLAALAEVDDIAIASTPGR